MTGTTADAAPVASPAARIVTLDILRGVAVMGILAMNIVAFAMPVQAYFNPLAYGGSTADLVTWFINFVLVDGKMRGFFSVLFGASMLLVIDRAEAAGGPPASVHYRRMIWLLVFGLLHLMFIWWGDILAHYALIGMIAYAFRHRSTAGMVKWAIGFLVVAFVFMASSAAGFAVMEALAQAPNASAADIRAWTDASASLAPPSASALATDLAVHRGDYAGLVAHRLLRTMTSLSFQFFFSGPETLAYMLFGMAGLRSGFLTGEWDMARYRRVAWGSLGVAVPLYAALGWWLIADGFSVPMTFSVAFAATVPIRPLMVLGYAALLILLTRKGGLLVDRVAAAGRAAFSNYLGTSILMTTLFYGYGFGLYGHLDRAQLYLVVAVTCALMLLWSKPWLDRFHYGPLEWLWRALARWEVPPFRKAIG